MTARENFRRAFAALLFLLLQFSGHCAENTAGDSSKLIVRTVLPSDTDSRIDKSSGDGWEHYIYLNPSVPDRKQLLVFLPGTGGKGGGAKAFLSFAANQGFHVISLAYPSQLSISAFRESPDPDAFLKARNNLIYGKPPFGRLNTGVPNSIQNRLHFLLHHLIEHFPQENWRQFMREGGKNFDYRTMILAGQSQGGGHAALIGYQHEVARVLMFGSPKDFSAHFNKPAKWFGGERVTPLDRFFSFVHSKDEGHGCSYAQQVENYRAMKLLPTYPIVDVDHESPPFAHTRLLTSTRDVDGPHGAPIGNEDFAPVWKYLLEEPVR